MTIVELIKILLFGICRFFVWVFTSRDCEHCDWSYENWWEEIKCSRCSDECEECRKTIHRKHFERGRWFV